MVGPALHGGAETLVANQGANIGNVYGLAGKDYSKLRRRPSVEA